MEYLVVASAIGFLLFLLGGCFLLAGRAPCRLMFLVLVRFYSTN